MSRRSSRDARAKRIARDAIAYPLDPLGYAERVRELEAEGLTTSDAQGVADAELRKHQQKPGAIAATRRPASAKGPRLTAAKWRVGDRFELRYDYSTEGRSMLAGATGRITLIHGPPNSVAFVVFDSAPTHAPVPVGLAAIARLATRNNPQWLNSPEVYENAGMEAGRSTRHGDAATAKQWREWMGRAVKLERPENRTAAQSLYDAAYKKAAAPRGPISNPAMTVTLGHHRNPDIAAGYWRPPIDPGRKHKVPVASIEDAVLVSRAFIERNGLGGGNWAGGQIQQGGKVIGRVAYNGRFFARGDRNPRRAPSSAPAASRAAAHRVKVPRRELNAAVELFHKFREAPPRRVRLARFKVPKVCVVIGEMDFVGYTTTHAKKRARYRHDFSRGARPLLCASADGRQLLIFGGNYDFTRDGIVDRA